MDVLICSKARGFCRLCVFVCVCACVYQETPPVPVREHVFVTLTKGIRWLSLRLRRSVCLGATGPMSLLRERSAVLAVDAVHRWLRVGLKTARPTFLRQLWTAISRTLVVTTAVQMLHE